MKKSQNGFKEEFNYDHRHRFSCFTEEDEGFLSSAEKQFLIMKCLNSINADGMGTIPGFPKATLYADRPISKVFDIFK